MTARLHDAVRRVVAGFRGRGARGFTNKEALDGIRQLTGDAYSREEMLQALDDFCAFGTFLDDPAERRRRQGQQLEAMEALLTTALELGVEDDEPVLETIGRRLRARALS